MDILDRAQKDIDTLAKFETKSLDPNMREAEPTGYCLYCGEPLENGRRFCNRECMLEWERERKLRRQHGKGC